MGTNYVMKGWDILYNKEVEWISSDKPDLEGNSSGINPINLTAIRVVQTISTDSTSNTFNTPSNSQLTAAQSLSTGSNSNQNNLRKKNKKRNDNVEPIVTYDVQDPVIENLDQVIEELPEDPVIVSKKSINNLKNLAGIAIDNSCIGFDNGTISSQLMMQKRGNQNSQKMNATLVWLKDKKAWVFFEVDNSGNTDYLSLHTKSLNAQDYISIKYNDLQEALSGIVRIPNDTEIKSRNYQNKADIILLKADKANRVQIGSINNPVYVPGYEIIDNYIVQSNKGNTSESSKSGFIRLLNNRIAMSFRNSDNTEDVSIVATDSCDQIHIGDNKNKGIVHNTSAHGAHIFSIDNDIVLGVINTGIAFNSHIKNPTIQQNNQNNGSNGNTLTIKAQNTNSKNAIGGNLLLESGRGGAGDGVVDIKTGNDLKIRIFPSNYNTDYDVTNQRSPNNTNSNTILLFNNILRFSAANSSSKIKFDSVALDNQKANRFTLQGQKNIGVNGIGGDLYLSSGQGKKDPGSIVLQTGGIDKVSINQNMSIFNNNLSHEFKVGEINNITILKDKFITNRGRRRKVEVVDGIKGNYLIDECDDIIAVFPTRETTIFLPKNAQLGDTYDIKDAGGQSCENHIIIDGNGKNIDGDDHLILNDDYCSVTIIYNGTDWSII